MRPTTSSARLATFNARAESVAEKPILGRSIKSAFCGTCARDQVAETALIEIYALVWTLARGFVVMAASMTHGESSAVNRF